MKKYLILLCTLCFFLMSDSVYAAEIFRKCTYNDKNVTFEIQKDGITRLHTKDDSYHIGSGSYTSLENKDEIYSGTNFNEYGCPTYIVNTGGKWYGYYDSAKATEKGGTRYIKQKDVIQNTNNKSSYDSKCKYNFNSFGRNLSVTYYIYPNKFIYGVLNNGTERTNHVVDSILYQDNVYISSQHFKNYDMDSSVDCPQIKGCEINDHLELYPGAEYVCSGNEIVINPEKREYSGEYDGSTVEDNKKSSCKTTLKFSDTIGGDLEGEVVDITLTKYSNGKRCLFFNGSENCSEANSSPVLYQTYKSRGISIFFEEQAEADKIFNDAFQSDGSCSGINIRQANSNTHANLILTTKALDYFDSAGTVLPNQYFGEDFYELYDDTWDQKDGCAILNEGKTIEYLRKILDYLRFGAVAALLILGSVDFIGAIISKQDDALKKAAKKFKNRFIACIIVFLVPTLVNLLLFVIDKSETVCNLLTPDDVTVERPSGDGSTSGKPNTGGSSASDQFSGICKYQVMKSNKSTAQVTFGINSGKLNKKDIVLKLNGITYTVTYKGKENAFANGCPNYLYAKVGAVKKKKATITISDTRKSGYQAISASQTGLSANDGVGSGMGGKAKKISIQYNVKDKEGRCGKGSGDYCAQIATVDYPNGTIKYYMGNQTNSGLYVDGSCRINAFACGMNATKNSKYSAANLYSYLNGLGYGGNNLRGKEQFDKVIKHYNVKAKAYFDETSISKSIELARNALDNGQPVIIFVSGQKCSDLAGSHHALLLLGYDKAGNVIFLDSVGRHRSAKPRNLNELGSCMSGDSIAKNWMRMVIFSF